MLADLIIVDRTYVQRCLDAGRTTRVCSLRHEAIRHLQWAMGAIFGRNPRGDFEWPSRSDLRLMLPTSTHGWDRAETKSS
jgi:hypothetical protein